MVCKYKVDKEVVKADIMDQVKNCFFLSINENVCLLYVTIVMDVCL